MHLDRHGWLTGPARHCPSPNANPRPADVTIRLLVIHNISLPPGQFGGPEIEQLFTNQLPTPAGSRLAGLRGLQVSAHFLVRRPGDIVQFVSTQRRAWHAGVSHFRGKGGCNDFSIGIELEGTDHIPYTDAQYQQLARLTRVLRARHPLRAVTGHEHIAPGRKTDPGPAFDWGYYGRLSGWQPRQVVTTRQAPG